MFCQATGYGGTVQQGSTVEEKLQKRLREQDISLESAAAARNLTVTFNADVSDGMNWKFIPTQRSVKINPGQSTLAFYTAHNLSDKAITGNAFWGKIFVYGHIARKQLHHFEWSHHPLQYQAWLSDLAGVKFSYKSGVNVQFPWYLAWLFPCPQLV